MKACPKWDANSPVVLSSPNNYYVDPDGRVNEIEDNEERILFGTVENPITIRRYTDSTYEKEMLFIHEEHDARLVISSLFGIGS